MLPPGTRTTKLLGNLHPVGDSEPLAINDHQSPINIQPGGEIMVALPKRHPALR